MSRLICEKVADLSRAFEDATRGLAITGTSVSITRAPDATFELDLYALGPRTAEQNRAAAGLVKTIARDAVWLREAIAWARSAHAPVEIRARFEWAPKTSFEERVAELRDVVGDDAAPARVEISRGAPTTERGEEPRGQASVRVRLAFPDGAWVESYLEFAYTSGFDHESVGGAFAARGEALAKALGVPCEITA